MHHISVKRPLGKEKNHGESQIIQEHRDSCMGDGLPTDATLGVSFFVWRLRRHNYIASFGRVATFCEAAWMPVSTRTMC